MAKQPVEKVDLDLPVPKLQNRFGDNPVVKEASPFKQKVNNATRMMHAHAGIRKGRQTV